MVVLPVWEVLPTIRRAMRVIVQVYEYVIRRQAVKNTLQGGGEFIMLTSMLCNMFTCDPLYD